MKTTAAKLARDRDPAQATAKLQRTLMKKHCPGQKEPKTLFSIVLEQNIQIQQEYKNGVELYAGWHLLALEFCKF